MLPRLLHSRVHFLSCSTNVYQAPTVYQALFQVLGMQLESKPVKTPTVTELAFKVLPCSIKCRDSPGGPVVKALHSQCRDADLIPGQGIQPPVPCGMEKNKGSSGQEMRGRGCEIKRLE